MAKSIRSKWKRKMRNLKRVRYGAKELEILKSVVGAKSEMKSLSDIVTVVDANELQQEQSSDANDHGTSSSVEPIDADESSSNEKLLLDENGRYPPWVGSRQLKKLKVMNRKKQNKLKKLKRKLKR